MPDVVSPKGYHPVFQCVINSNVIYTVPPQYMVSFSIERYSDNAGSELEINFIDPEFDFIESAILGTNHELVYRYGYAGEDEGPVESLSESESAGIGMTPWKRALITDYKPTIRPAGASISLNAISLENLVNNQTRSEVYRGKISEVVEAIAERNNWSTEDDDGNLTIVETKDVLSDIGNSENWEEATEYAIKDQWAQTNLSDIAFIQRALIPLAESVDGLPGYMLYFEDDPLKGTPRIHFRPRDLNEDRGEMKVYQCIYQSEGTVLEWTPEFDSQLMFRLGGSLHLEIANDSTTETAADYQTEPSDVNTAHLNGSNASDEELQAFTLDHSLATNPNEARKIARNRLQRLYSMAYGGTLRIVGDHTLIPTQKLEVRCILPGRNELHYSSGIYQIYKIKDTIEGGLFTSMVTLISDSVGAPNTRQTPDSNNIPAESRPSQDPNFG